MKRPVRVSDHAVLRYLERVGGFDIETLRQNMARRINPNQSAAVSYVDIGDHTLVVRCYAGELVVKTVIVKPARPSRKAARREGGK